jgi:hypothetical protein
MNRPNASVFFLICAVVDFVIGCIKSHLFVGGIGATIGGLPLTALLFLLFRARANGNEDKSHRGDDDHSRDMANLVP